MPPQLFSRAVGGVIRGYERWKAVAFATLARKAEEPTKSELLQQALATVGITDWDDTRAMDVDFIAELAPDLPQHS